MNNAVRWLSILKWGGFVLGAIMYLVVHDVVGEFWSVTMATAATVSFWMIVRKEETRQFERSIAQVIHQAIREYNGARTVVEVRRIRTGAVARVYVEGDEEVMSRLLNGMKQAVSQALKRAGVSQRVWVLQMTTIGTEADISRKREVLNRQMINDLNAIRKQREQREKQNHRDPDNKGE
jgi:hypothetical protein